MTKRLVNGELAGVKLGDGYPVRVMGTINVSPESFYKGSVKTTSEGISELAAVMVKEGADIIDVGGMSTAPYLTTEVPLEVEVGRLTMAIGAIRDAVKVPISVDTPRSIAARAALEAGAGIVNDVSGLKHDERMAKLIVKHGASAILMAHETRHRSGEPIKRILAALKETLDLGAKAGIPEGRIVIDPGLGFFRREGRGFGFSPAEELPWYAWDCMVIRELGQFRSLGRPSCISISRKSFIGKILGLQEPNERLIGSLAATAVAVFNGVHLVRTHDVGATTQAVRMAESIKKLGTYGSLARVRAHP
ncbi:MAG: dihydropteroate synthase [Nitrososphaerales archaeon]|nr:dihydropteroate synthase [Nitrososphaerales archaeon]